MEEIMGNLKKVRTTILLMSLFFIVLSVFLMHNSSQFLLFNDRQTIKTMQLVGAQSGFIKKPYLQRAFYIGLTSWFVSVVITGTMLIILNGSVKFIADILVAGFVIVVFVSILFIAIILPMISTYIIVNLYLKQNSNIH